MSNASRFMAYHEHRLNGPEFRVIYPRDANLPAVS